MQVYVMLKSAGKRRPVLEKTPYTLPDGVATVSALIEAVVREEVARYNSAERDADLVGFLTEGEIEDRSEAGKIGFGRRYGEKQADADKAVETALQAYEDGLFRLFIGEEQQGDKGAAVSLKEGDVLTFIRFTFLAGRLY